MHIEGYLVFNEELIEKAVKTAKEEGLLVSLDLASFNVVEAKLDFLKRIVGQYVDILFANEEEAHSYTGLPDPTKALEAIAEQVKVSIVKVGKNGSMILKDSRTTNISVIEAKPIDTTGAGDYYASGFLYGYLNDLSLDQSGKIGSLLVGKVIEEMGGTIMVFVW